MQERRSENQVIALGNAEEAGKLPRRDRRHEETPEPVVATAPGLEPAPPAEPREPESGRPNTQYGAKALGETGASEAAR